MKITANNLRKKWDSINFYNGGYVLLENTKPLQWHIGYKEIGQKTLLLITVEEPDLLPPSKSIIVTKGQRTDGNWTLSFTLMRVEQDNVFETFCADIIVHSLLGDNEKVSIQLISKRYKQWHKLFEQQKKSLMAESSQKGLLGELIFLENLLKQNRFMLPIVQGWGGPDGEDQDFIYSDYWYEIKSIGLAGNSVTISSLEQLSNETPGFIIVMRLDKCVPERTGAVSLTEQVKRILNLLKEDIDAFSLFEHKLLKYGFIDISEYNEQKYIFGGSQRFEVKDDFPRLIRKTIPLAISAVNYSIELSAIEHFRKEG